MTKLVNNEMVETITVKGNTYKKERLCLVFDCETMAYPLDRVIFDYGWQVVDLDSGDILVKKSYVSSELYDEALVNGRAFLINDGTVKQDTYFKQVLNGEIKIMSEKDIFVQLKRDMKKVQFMSAYNISFDKSALEKTHFRTFGREFEEIENIQLLDIYNLACNTMLNTDEYRAYCEEHETGDNRFISEKGNYKTGAEACYAYLTQNGDHIESHTALNDVKEETEILLYLLNNYHVEMKYIEPNMQAWKVPNIEKLAKREKTFSITEKQKQFLTILGYTGTFEMSKKVASNIIQELLAKENEE